MSLNQHARQGKVTAAGNSGKQRGYSKKNDSFDKVALVEKIDAMDSLMGFERMDGEDNDTNGVRKGWLINMHPTTVPSNEYAAGYAGVDYYFLDEEGGSFKVTLRHDPYFYVAISPGYESEVEEYLRKILESCGLKNLTRLTKEDLSLPNHLVGLKKDFIKIAFYNVGDLLSARRVLFPIVHENKLKKSSRDAYLAMNYASASNYGSLSTFNEDSSEPIQDVSLLIEDIREYDVPYHVRVSIDNDIRIGKWYDVETKGSSIILKEDRDKIAFADPVIMAFDIEATKAPLKFPDAATDQIITISYMIDGEGFLITNREIITEDIEEFEYTPKPEYPGNFTIFNEADEKALLGRFFEHIRDARPTVIATFNGDFFDWPFVEKRTNFYEMNLFDEIGFARDSEGEYKSKYCSHMDCFCWVKRDSYLPQGSQGLKAVTTAKLGYNPIELDPELMTPYAYENPQLLSEYSVSDAVATYYLYYKYVHPFIFSLCTIIPLNPDEVLRKGTGTLCEMLLLVQAYKSNIILPHKHSDPIESFYEGHLLESETYVGGHVESLEAGVFRSDLSYDFKIDTTVIDELLSYLREAICFCIEKEHGRKVDEVVNFEETYDKIKFILLDLKNNPVRNERPLIYHVDVASMYPNIMTSNRLQPDSIKTEEDCATCDFNRPNKTCDRRMPWSWRGEFLPAEMNEYGMIKRTLQNEVFPSDKSWGSPKLFEEMLYSEQASILKKRLRDYSKKVYHRITQSKTFNREAIICQRENPFYVNTVRAFRDRRYEFKTLAKVMKNKFSKLDQNDLIGKDDARKMVILYDSLQLAHKVILNSFYGYVMRKGSRWYSMEMAGVTCLTGALIIQMARSLVERLGRPLELDTDGIWCILPKSFPENFTLECKDGKKIILEYPCSMLNYLVHDRFTNNQYQDLVDPSTFKYETRSENSIFFEVDGPYRAMILPTSREEGKGLKKRYAVFNEDGSLAELKGFELKRRGELQLIKNFQSDIFKLFLEGDSLENCYKAVAKVANNWLDVLETRGGTLEDEDLIELICENRSMSKSVEEYGDQKSTSITTARRLGEFLGEEMIKDAGLACKYVISAKPLGSAVTERAIPVSIFSSERKEYFLRKWLKDPSLQSCDPRDVIDWGYYYERLAYVVQKIISIPAALQNVENPVPRIPHPDWLQKKINLSQDKKQQSSISAFFGQGSKTEIMRKQIKDIEDFGKIGSEVSKPKLAKVTSRKRKSGRANYVSDSEEEERNMSVRLNSTPPSINDNYSGFLEHQKVKWLLQAKTRERRRKLFGSNTESSSRSSVGNMIRKQAENVVGTNWEILDYKLDDMSPGDIKALVLVNGKIHRFTFHVPRKFYISFKTSLSLKKHIPGCIIQKSNAILPNGHDGTNLYHFTMDESTYLEERKKVENIFYDSNVLALYETQVGPIERVVIELGNTVGFDDTRVGSLGKGLKNGFSTKDLRHQNNPSYLQNFNMDIVYLLHIVSNSYEFIGFFKSWENSASIYVLKPTSNAQELPPSVEKLYREMFTAKKEKLEEASDILQYPEEMNFDIIYFSNHAKLFKSIDHLIEKTQESRSTSALFAIQSPYTNKLLNKLRAASNFPTIKMNISELKLPAVGWQSLILKRLLNHYFVLATWIKKLISLANYNHVPLCNLQIENLGYLIDIEFARRLSESSIVLWWSPTPLPDHGGFEMNGSQDFTNLEFPVLNNPEIYETSCLEIEVRNLTINAILTSALINDAEGADLANEAIQFDDNNVASTLAQDSFSTPALSVLKSMVKSWWSDAFSNNENADAMMNNLATWVQRKSSLLYDYSLHYHVHNLVCKALFQMLAEFKRMNACIIFANRNKLILATTKVSVENSYAYAKHLIKSTRSKPLFHFLDLEIKRYWDILVWMDEYNFGGRYCLDIMGDGEQALSVSNKWHIKNFLPSFYQKEFEDWMVIFLDAVAQRKKERCMADTMASPRMTQVSHLIKMQHESEDPVMEDSNLNVTDLFRKVLIKRVEKLAKYQNESILNPELREEFVFPILLGSHTKMHNPTMELVKFLCAVFGLSRKRNVEVRMLRRDLLSIFEAKEFSKESVFVNPSLSLKIPEIICDYCNYVRDIDFCKENPDSIWNCCKCHKSYNRVTMEEELICLYRKHLTNYYCQDFRCSKCHQIKSDRMSEYCKCSGTWIETYPYHELEQKIGTFNRIASIYKMLLLKICLEEHI